MNAGQAEADVLRQLGDPRQLAEWYLSSVLLEAARLGRRAAAKLVDLAAAAAIVIPVVCGLFFMVPREYQPARDRPGIRVPVFSDTWPT